MRAQTLKLTARFCAVVAFSSNSPVFAQHSLPTIDVGGVARSQGVRNSGPTSSAAARSAQAAPPQAPRPAVAQQTAPKPQLDTVASTASRLGLTPRQTPASIYTMGYEEMRERGFFLVQDAVASFPGVTVGDDPASPASFSMRGFTGNQITILRDGLYLGPPGMINRPANSFNVQSVEVLKGPASVLYGQGAVGGVINVRTKEPEFGPTRMDGLISAGSFNTLNLGVGVSTQLNEQMAARVDVSRSSSSGFVDNAPSNSFNLTASLLWKPSSNFNVKFGMDFMADNLSPYFGTPLIPGAFTRSRIGGAINSRDGQVLDRDMRFKNYNVADPLLASTQIMPTAVVTWTPTDNISVKDTAYYLHADRAWKNAESFTFLGPNNGQVDAFGNPIPPGSIGRDRFYVFHNQNTYGNILTATIDHDLFGFKNKALIGADLSTTHFVRDRGFPDAGFADFVVAWNPSQRSLGIFPGEYPIRRSPTRVDRYAGLFEDVLQLTPALKLVTGARYEFERLDRVNYNQDGTFNPRTSFRRNFHPFNFRAGAIYDLTSDVSVYGQYTTAQDPVGANYLLVNANQNFNLSSSRQGEVGVKASFDNGRGEATIALYEIRRSNILTQTGQDRATNVGSQMSRGVELSSNFWITPQWRMNVNAAYTFTRYGFFVDPANGLNASGLRPPNVPTWTANMWTVYSRPVDLPLDVAFGLRYVGDRTGNNSNTLFLTGYLLADTYATYHLTENLDATLRINNLFDKTYVQWASVFYPGQVLLGAPRSFSFALTTKF